MSKCCGCREVCNGLETYQPLQQTQNCNTLKLFREGSREGCRTPRDHTRKLSIRYDAVRIARKESEESTPYRHLPGTLRVSVNLSHSNPQSQPPHRHELRCTPPPTNYPNGPHGCALHSRLDQPVTSSSTGMDSKKNLQMASPSSAQVRNKGGGDGTPAVSGVRRKSGPQGLRSPAAKRPLSAPVALQGWLHKQGSEGLMLWKRRWFVLSEYCLFYYKGPEEEKLLGSILLPSYRVTICRPEDKVNKKFAFKAEHANMRTYHFAAETRESLNQWVNALTLASLLQDPNPRGDEASSPLDMAGPADGDGSARPSVSSISSILNQSADDSDSGFHGFQSRDDPSHTSNNNSSPNSANTASFPNLHNNGNSNGNNNGPSEVQSQPMANGWMQQSPQYGQPGPSQQYNQFHHQLQHIPQSLPPHQQSYQSHQQSYQSQTLQSNPQSHPPPLQSHSQTLQSHPQPLQSHSQVLQSVLQSQTLQTHQVVQSHSQVVQTHSQVLQSHSQILQSHNQSLQSHNPSLQSQNQSLQSHSQHPVSPQQVANNIVHTVQPMPRNYCQPVYANTPPKPRRLTEGTQNDYSIPSPDADFRKSPVSQDMRMTSKSPMHEYERNTTIYGTRGAAQQTQASLRTDKSGLNYGLNYNQERRTPDTYGRSAKPRAGRGNGDYEDVYGAPQLYQRPAGPVGYTKAPAPAPIPIPVYAQQIQQQQQVYDVSPQVAPIMRQPKVHPPPRPHSADFLEYEANRRPDQQTLIQSDSLQNQSRRPQRPKSSLDIVNPSDSPVNDNYFYSEERYAAQMRQSAVYIHQTPQHQQQRNSSISRATTPSMSSNKDRDVESGIGTLSENSCSGIRRSRGDHVQHITNSQPLQRHNDLASNEALLRRSLRERSYESSSREMLIHNESGTVPRRMPREYEQPIGVARSSGMTSHVSNHTSYGSPTCNNGPRRWNEQQFARSASARLPRTRHPAIDHEDVDYSDRSPNHDSRDGERKIQQREESMKRLLEWKQRMLQSPLTRKPSGSTNRGTAQNELSNYYKQQALLDLAAHEASVAEARHSRRREETHRPHVRSKSSDGRRSVTNVSRYNSYSSDDEELGDVRRKRTRRPSHTGRSPRNFGEERSPTTPVDNTHKSSVAGIVNPSTLCGIPPDAGYEEVNYLQGKSTATKERNSPKKDHFSESLETPKKPSGILKTPSVYSNQPVTRNEDGKLSTLAGYIPGETWQTSKNVQWKSKDQTKYWPDSESKTDIRLNSKPDLTFDSKSEIQSLKPEEVNLVQSRIKSFESCSSPVKETLTMQEPLKISPPQATEAHVSKLDSSRKPEKLETPGEEAKKNKSVKDLLADFERKSQQVRKQEDDKRKEVKHRGVFSDTETLLYDTGSDLDQPEKSGEEDFRDREYEKFQEYQKLQKKEVMKNSDLMKNQEMMMNTELMKSQEQKYKMEDYRQFQEYSKSQDYEKLHEYLKNRDYQEEDVREFTECSTSRDYQKLQEYKQDYEKLQEYQEDYQKLQEYRQDYQKLKEYQEDYQKLQEYQQEYQKLQEYQKDYQKLQEYKKEDNQEFQKRQEYKKEDQKNQEYFEERTKTGEIQDGYTGTIRRKPEDRRRRRKTSKGEDLENPYTRLSMTESLVTHGDQFSDDSEDNSSIPKENASPENHYLPMSPRKSILDPNADDTPTPQMMESLFANLDHEESSYVEMTQNGLGRSLLAPSSERKQDYGNYSTLETPHYEFVCVSDNKMEPVYMEVSQLEKEEKKGKKEKRDQVERAELPDILTALKSDSSDADDESSKDLDSIDAPRHPRFSLSDTFRPASYYLGASRTLIAELHDSSDSELVSPPPIPISPPPMEELDSLDTNQVSESKDYSPNWNRSSARFSEESTFRDSRASLESAGSDSAELRIPDEEARHRQMKRRPVSDEVCEVLDGLDELESLGSRFDGASIDLDQYLEELQARDAFNVDLYAKDLSYNSIYGFNENMMVIDKLQKTDKINLDQPFSYGSRGKTSSASSLPSIRVSDLPPSHQHSQSFTGDAHYENVSSFAPLTDVKSLESPGIVSGSYSRRMSPIDCRNFVDRRQEICSGEIEGKMSSGDGGIDRGMASIERGMSSVDRRMSSIDRRISSVDRRISSVDRKISRVDRKMSPVDRRISPVDKISDRKSFDRRMSPVEKRISSIDRRAHKTSPGDKRNETSTCNSRHQITSNENRNQEITDRRSFSPIDRGALSPIDKRILSPIDRTMRSPVDRGIVSPIDRGITSPIDRRIQEISPTEKKTREASPNDRRTLSPMDRRTFSPVDRDSVPPNERGIISPNDRGTLSPIDRTFSTSTSSPIERRTLSPIDTRVQEISPRLQSESRHQHSRSESQDSARYSLSPNHRSSSSQDSKTSPQTSYLPCTTPSDQSAPYYYSDLQTGSVAEAQPRSSLFHTSRLPQLNNQRGDTSVNKRNDIGRMVNPIARQMPRQIPVDDIDEARRIAAELRKTTSQFLAEDKAGLVDKRNFYEADTLRRVKSTDPLPDVSLPDISTRNLYPQGLRDKSEEAPEFPVTTSHRRSRSLEGLLDDVGLQNLVEERNRANRNLSESRSSERNSRGQTERTRNCETSRRDTVGGQENEANRIARETNSRSRESEENFRYGNRENDFGNNQGVDFGNSQGTFGGEDPWEQDSLWRESLRRVSLRHARSLDNLDSPPRPSRPELKPKTRIIRGATYVNDSVSLRDESRVKRRSNESHVEDSHSSKSPNPNSNKSPNSNNKNPNSSQSSNSNQNQNPNSPPSLNSNPNENQNSSEDAYESLSMDRIGAGGYVWDSKNEAYRKPSGLEKHFLVEGNLPPIGSSADRRKLPAGNSASFELDREKLRQWDLVSSACLLQEQQRTSMADSGRGLPINDRVSTGLEGSESCPRTTSSEPDQLKRIKTEGDLQEATRAAASQSGSVIGRDPLPSRAVSTSQLPQKSLTQLPPTQVSTLPLSRHSGSNHRQQPLPIHQSTPQSSKQLDQGSLINSQILKAASSGDVRLNSTLESRISSPSGQSSQRLMSPSSHLRVVSPIDHRVSSPSDSERQLHSPTQLTQNGP